MPEISDEALEWARERFRAGVADLLDDPSDLLHPGRSEDPPAYLAKERKLAADLGMDFDAIVAQTGTDFERKRLRDIETGKLAPSTPLNPHYWD